MNREINREMSRKMNNEINEVINGDIHYVAALPLPWEKLEGKTVLISGASGMIGSFLVSVLMARPENIRVIGIGRDMEKARKRFARYWERPDFLFLSHDMNQPLSLDERADFIIHAASNTHPAAYSADPIGTMTTNLLGTLNLLEFAAAWGNCRFLFASSVEVYGENRGDQKYFDEAYCGYIDCNTARAGYPESKRAGEALCQSYIRQKGVDAVIARLSRTYGPTMLLSDTKAVSQFLKKGAAGEDIVLKSAGNQLYSYSYVADAVSGLLTVLLKGECGQAYNIADTNSDITLKELSAMIAEKSGTKVVFQLPDAREAAGYSTATTALMDGGKLKGLGWQAHWDMEQGVERTLKCLQVRMKEEAGA